MCFFFGCWADHHNRKRHSKLIIWHPKLCLFRRLAQVDFKFYGCGNFFSVIKWRTIFDLVLIALFIRLTCYSTRDFLRLSLLICTFLWQTARGLPTHHVNDTQRIWFCFWAAIVLFSLNRSIKIINWLIYSGRWVPVTIDWSWHFLFDFFLIQIVCLRWVCLQWIQMSTSVRCGSSMQRQIERNELWPTKWCTFLKNASFSFASPLLWMIISFILWVGRWTLMVVDSQVFRFAIVFAWNGWLLNDFAN